MPRCPVAMLAACSRWVREFLGKPHPDLGRAGPVCPYVPRALALDCIRTRVVRLAGGGLDEIRAVVEPYRHDFFSIEPRTGRDALFRAQLLLFPDLEGEQAASVDAAQRRLRPDFVREGLMIGEFHSESSTQGLHSTAFRPLRSPGPMLAIRMMVEQDLVFLLREPDPVVRAELLTSFLRHLGDRASQRTLTQARAALGASHAAV